MNIEKYERLSNEYLSKIRRVRFQYSSKDEEKILGVDKAFDSRVFNIAGQCYDNYSWIVTESIRLTWKFLAEVVCENLNENHYSFTLLPVGTVDPCAFGIVLPEKEDNMLILFKEFGMDKRMNDDPDVNPYMRFLVQKYQLKYLKYVSLVEDYAYKEQINRNQDIKDPSRGTGIYSLKWFFTEYFNDEEYNCFIKVAKALNRDIVNCIGIRVVKDLSSSSLYAFKHNVNRHLRKYKIKNEKLYSFDLRKEITAPETVIALIDKHVKENELYLIMTGQRSYAKSFITAEWLFDSLKQVDSPDLSEIIMGYCKAVELLLYSLILTYINEGKWIKSNLRFNKYKGNYYNTIAYKEDGVCKIHLDSNNIEKSLIDNSGGALVHFLKDNRDVFRNDIESDGQNYIIAFLDKSINNRNKYFHKTICSSKEWESVIVKIRDDTYKAIYFLLGAIQIPESYYTTGDCLIKEFNFEVLKRTEYQKLEEYMYFHTECPFFVKANDEESPGLLISETDRQIIRNDDSEPFSSGIIFRSLDKKKIYRYDVSSVPDQIFTGEMVPNPKKLGLIFKKKGILWDNGRFYEQEEDDIDY